MEQKNLLPSNISFCLPSLTQTHSVPGVVFPIFLATGTGGLPSRRKLWRRR